MLIYDANLDEDQLDVFFVPFKQFFYFFMDRTFTSRCVLPYPITYYIYSNMQSKSTKAIVYEANIIHYRPSDKCRTILHYDYSFR